MILWQDSMYRSGKYGVLDVDQDCVRMSEFIKTNLNCKFEDRKVFYEVTENEEDLLYYKKMLRPQMKKVSYSVASGVMSYYYYLLRENSGINPIILNCAARLRGFKIAITH